MKKLLLLFASLTFASLIFLGGVSYAAGPFEQICKTNPNASVCVDSRVKQDPNGSNSIYGPNSLLAKAISIASLAVGIVSVIMIIVGGLKYAASSGDANNVNSAKNTILYALIGLVIAALSQAIVLFVINKL